MIILAKEYTDFIKRIKKTINNMGKSCSVCTLMPNTDHDADDVFGFYDRYINDENICLKPLSVSCERYIILQANSKHYFSESMRQMSNYLINFFKNL